MLPSLAVRRCAQHTRPRRVAAVVSRSLSTLPNATTGATSTSNTLGVVGWNVYVPKTYVSQEALESFDGVSPGKYTAGLGQSRMAVAGAQEDIVSMMLSATQGLLETTGVSPDAIGRLEVGTETLVDKSKSVKTSLMRLFGDHTDIEGVDTINACYGGTNALFNCLNWMASPAWDGRYAIVVTGDIAVYEAGPARPTGGAGAIAMLIGPDAPVVFDLSAPRASHMEDAYDFYKPDLASEYPRVDGQLSNACYLRAVDKCFRTLAAKTEARTTTPFDVRNFEHAIFHQPYQKLVLKSFARYAWNQHQLTGDVSSALDAFLEMEETATYTSRELEKAALEAVKAEYTSKVFPSTLLGRECGNMYTGSLYAGLASLVGQASSDLHDQSALMFSYGSGLAATMFPAKFNANATGVQSADVPDTVEDGTALEVLAEQVALPSLLERVEVEPEEYATMMREREATYGVFPVDIQHQPAVLRDGAFYLKAVDGGGRREYGQV